MNNFKCNNCGKFIGYNEFKNNKASINFTPESNKDGFSNAEEIYYQHKKCFKTKRR